MAIPSGKKKSPRASTAISNDPFLTPANIMNATHSAPKAANIGSSPNRNFLFCADVMLGHSIDPSENSFFTLPAVAMTRS